MHRNYGRLYAFQGNAEAAIDAFAKASLSLRRWPRGRGERGATSLLSPPIATSPLPSQDVFHTSLAAGPESVDVCAALFLMEQARRRRGGEKEGAGRPYPCTACSGSGQLAHLTPPAPLPQMFQSQQRVDAALAMADKVVDVYYKHLLSTRSAIAAALELDFSQTPPETLLRQRLGGGAATQAHHQHHVPSPPSSPPARSPLRGGGGGAAAVAAAVALPAPTHPQAAALLQVRLSTDGRLPA